MYYFKENREIHRLSNFIRPGWALLSFGFNPFPYHIHISDQNKRLMKIAIVGEAKRAKAWEKHLRGLSAIQEVIISPILLKDPIDACIILDDSINNLNLLSDAVRRGFHSYLVAQLPLDEPMIEKIYHASEEAEVNVQFSHWPSHSPSTQWIKQQMPKPTLIQIKKELSSNGGSEGSRSFEQQWVDELAFIIRFFHSSIQHIVAKPIKVEERWLGLQITLRFNDGSVSSLQYNTTAEKDAHQRILSSNGMMIDCDVITQKSRRIEVNAEKRIKTTQKTFDPSETVQLSVINFIKSIQLKKKSEFSAYDALKTVQAHGKILENLRRF